MNMRYRYTEEDIAIVRQARKNNKDKRVERRLRALELKFLGQHTDREIAEIRILKEII